MPFADALPGSAAPPRPASLSFLPLENDVLLTSREVAQLLRVSQGTLYRWRLYGEGPPYVRVGSRPRYPLGGLRRYAPGRLRAVTVRGPPKTKKRGRGATPEPRRSLDNFTKGLSDERSASGARAPVPASARRGNL